MFKRLLIIAYSVFLVSLGIGLAHWLGSSSQGASLAERPSPPEQDGSPPILISPVVDLKGRAGRPEGPNPFEVQLTNVSEKPIVAYVLRLFVVPDDPAIRSRPNWTHMSGRKFIPTDPGEPWAPGESWSVRRSMPTFNIRQPGSDKEVPVKGDLDIQLDLVVFEDGEMWGPSTAKQHMIISGMHQGCYRERDRLRRLLLAKGEDALIEEVMRLAPESGLVPAQRDIPPGPVDFK